MKDKSVLEGVEIQGSLHYGLRPSVEMTWVIVACFGIRRCEWVDVINFIGLGRTLLQV